jgi:hypothetical protein
MVTDDYNKAEINLVSERALDAACGAVGLDLQSAGAKRYRNALLAAAPIIVGEFLEQLGTEIAGAGRGMLDE